MQKGRPKASKQLSSTSRKSSNVVSRAAEGTNPGEIWLDCGPLEAEQTEGWRPAIERLKKIYQVPTAADLHPGLAFADKPWPSPSFGLVSDAVLELLQRSRLVFTGKLFKVDADPVNPLGDGKSWMLICEPTGSLPRDADPIALAGQCQAEVVRGAAEPAWDGQTILVPLWDCGGALAPSKQERSWSNARVVNGVRLLEIPKESTADTVATIYSQLRDAIRKARTWVQLQRGLGQSATPASICDQFPELNIANHEEIEQYVILQPNGSTDRAAAIEILQKHIPGQYAYSSIERMTRPLKAQGKPKR